MLRSIDEIIGYTLKARDGDIGRAKDIYFDSSTWAGRYLVADTNKWLPGRKVLIPLAELHGKTWEEGHVPVDLSIEQVKDSPSIDADKPVSRQFEEQIHTYFDWHPYWTPGAMHPAPGFEIPGTMTGEEIVSEAGGGDPNLHSAKEVMGYTVVAEDGEVGTVEDFLIDDEDWIVRYIVVRARDLGKDLVTLISVQWIDHVSWSDTDVRVKMTKAHIAAAPGWDRVDALTRDYEERLHTHYGEPRYWA